MKHESEKNLRILIIDDNPEIHKDFIKILTRNSSDGKFLDFYEKEIFGENPIDKIMLPEFSIDTSFQGNEGVSRVEAAIKENNPYSLAFVDIRMPPGWNGIETIKQIWQLDPDIQIVICTAYSDYSWEETVNELGSKENLLILKKPFDSIAVRQLACALTKKWQLMQAARTYTAKLQKEVSEQTRLLKYQATHDPLTGLPNRVLLLQKINEAIQNANQNRSCFAVLFIDLDRFKLINDSFSHSLGDAVLKFVTKRLQNALKTEDVIARLGGDEFIIIFSNLQNEQELISKTNVLQEQLKQPFTIKDREVVVTTSIGISIYPNDGDTADILLRNADAAMYNAKEMHGNNFKFYTEELNKKCLIKLEKEIQLRQALANKEFFLYYQPQIDLKTNQIVAVEALLRWNHPQKGILLPIDFIDVAEDTGLILPIGEWVLRNACMQNKKWQESGLRPIRVAVNITAQQFYHQNIVKLAKKILKETDLNPKYLELELTENVIVSNPEIIKAVTKLKEMGIMIALDDFGTGYSSLSYLKKIPLDRLKIDSSFIQHIQSTEDDEVIIRAIIAMAKNLNLEVLAEGVETQNQLQFLKAHECGEVQGFYFSKPLTKKEVEELLQEDSHIKIEEVEE